MVLPTLGPVKYLTIHCAATIEGRNHSVKEVSQWDIDRFGQISYHFVIPLNGKFERTLKDTEKGAHVGNHNTGNIGICYVGGLGKDGKPKDTRTPEQVAAMLTLIRTYKARYPGIKILGHRDWSPDINKNGKIDPFEWLKSCPCFDVAAWLKSVGE